MEQVAIEILRPEDIAETASLLARAMGPNPVNTAVYKVDAEKKQRLQEERFALVLTKRPGLTFVARSNGRVVGVLRIIKWPDCRSASPQNPTQSQAAPVSETDIPGRVQTWMSVWGSHDPREPHWHFGPFAVEPEMQRQGIGSRLFTRCCEEVDRNWEASYLETDRIENVRRYERFGFSVVAEDYVFDAKSWFMWRPARGKNL